MPSIILPSRLDLPRNGLVGYYTQRGPGNTGYLDHIAGRVSTFTNNGISWRSIDRMPKYLVQPVITSGGEHSLQRNARLGEPITIIAYANTYDASLFVEITDEFFFGLYPYGIGYPIFRRTKSGGGGNISHHVSENWKDKTAVFAVSHSGNLADTAKFYVDGQPKTTTVETSDTGAAAVTTNPVRLTPYKGGWTSAYNAGLPVLAIYNRELPAAEIRALSSKQFPSTLATCRRVLYFETAGGGTSQVTSDLADSYAIRSAVSQDCADSYAIRSAVSQDLADAYTLRALASGDLADSYAIRAAIAQDLSDAYDIQVAGAVASDLADTYAVRAAVAQDAADAYAIRAAVQASLADAYAVNAAVQASLADAYAIITAASADLEDGYVIRAQAVADLIDSYAVFAGVGGGSCPSAAEIAAAVRAELATELANLDAPVSDVPAAVWAHNLP